MAGISLETEGNFQESFAKLSKIFPELGGGLLAHIGSESRQLLVKNHLSGQDLNLKAYPRDSLGRYTVRSDVNKKRTQVKVYSYPVNLFEKGRKLRSGKKEKGKFIITKQLKSEVNTKMQSWTNEYEKKYVDKELSKL